MRAAIFNRPQELSMLIQAGADIHAQTDSGMTVLMFAASSREGPECLEILLQAGADALAITDQDETAMSMTFNKGHPDCVRLLKSHMERIALTASTPLAQPHPGRQTL